MRPVTLYTLQWGDLPLETVCQKAKEFGYDGLELGLPNHVDVRQTSPLRQDRPAPPRHPPRLYLGRRRPRGYPPARRRGAHPHGKGSQGAWRQYGSGLYWQSYLGLPLLVSARTGIHD